MINFESITTEANVATYEATIGVFNALLGEVRELSKKKPDASMSKGKVKVVNAVLEDLLTILEPEPEGKYLETLEDDELPQVSDALLMMVQFEAALVGFRGRYLKWVRVNFNRDHYWITEEQMEMWAESNAKLASA